MKSIVLLKLVKSLVVSDLVLAT